MGLQHSPPLLLTKLRFVVVLIHLIQKQKQAFACLFEISLGDGFEPPLDDPESSVLPLDDPRLLKRGTILFLIGFTIINYRKLLKFFHHK